MPDLGPVIAGMGELLAPLVRAALGAFLRTAAGMICVGLLVATLASGIAYDGSTWRGLLAALLVLAASAAVGALLSVKRAVGRAMLEGVQRTHAGRRLSEAVFSRLLGVDSGGEMGERGTALARAAERLPLAAAEERLEQVVQHLLDPDPGARGIRAGLARRIQHALLVRVKALTLARFREEDARHGGVDLELVRDEVAAQVDAQIARAVRAALNKVTLLVLGGLALGALALAYGIRHLPI